MEKEIESQKATFNISTKLLESLDEYWFQTRKAFEDKSITKTFIVEMALESYISRGIHFSERDMELSVEFSKNENSSLMLISLLREIRNMQFSLHREVRELSNKIESLERSFYTSPTQHS